MMEHSEDIACLESSLNYQLQILSSPSNTVVKPSVDVLNKAEADLLQKVPQRGLGIKTVTEHLLKTVAPALNNASISPNFYGFVTGGVTPAARVAESIVALYDQNVQVHLPDQTIATTVEDRALLLLLDLLRLDGETWSERTFTTGATSSNVLGLACGREYVIDEAIKRHSKGIENNDTNDVKTVTQHGLLAACRAAEVDDVQILTTFPHSSVKKASSICGLGHSSVHDVSQGGEYFLNFDLEKTEELLKRPRMASIVVISCGEVNTGYFATNSFEEFQTLRLLCDKYSAWIHVDAAFGIFARILSNSTEYQNISKGAEGLELADSITGDAHKLLNVPYDCGFFFCRHFNLAQQVFQNANAAYLIAGNTSAGKIKSPLNIGIENSRRFRALPVYATLICYGRSEYQNMLCRQIRLARLVAAYFYNHPEFELLPTSTRGLSDILQDVYIIVLFRANNDALNRMLVEKINALSKIYVSSTVWEGQSASRIAVSNWQAHPERDMQIIKSTIEEVLSTSAQEA